MPLNESQKKAITTKGNVFVVGNPGSGKTRLIVEKIKHLLLHNAKEDEILCLTFTNKAKEELSERLLNEQMANVVVDTFHSFAYEYVKDYLIERNINSALIKESMQRFLLYNILKKYVDETKLLRITNIFSQKISYFESFKIESFDFDEVVENIKKIDSKFKDFDLVRDLLEIIPKVLQEYKQVKKRYGVDYNDLLFYFLEYLKQNPINYKYLIVDEVQDTNELQTDIILELSRNGQRFLVGDLKQSIFRFQGASVNAMQRLKKDAVEIVLDKNYRSTQEILDYAKKFMINNTNKYHKDLSILKMDE